MGLGNPDYANTMYLLAKVLSQQGKGKDAEALIRESIRILEEAGLGESPACIQRMKFLSLELVKSKQLAEAENLQRKILHNLELSKVC
uniref:MalT-like TPR region domain-containing protein n=1 Tax=Aegilops tauschii subsp. strangulata TaxID=200361 RepID=A0A453QJJ1_AEGTS